MKNIKLLFSYNNKRKVKLKGNTLVITVSPCMSKKSTVRIFSGIDVEYIISIINGAHERYGKLRFKVILNLGEIEFIDKLTYIFIECICYYLIQYQKQPVQIYMKVINSIETSGINSSPLLLLNDTSIKSVRKFPQKFDFDIYGYHYRKLIKSGEDSSSNYLGVMYEDIERFLKPFGIEDKYRQEVAQVVTELIGNANEHAGTDCLVDIDVAPDYIIEGAPSLDYCYGINIAVINFSDILVGDGIKNNVLNKNRDDIKYRYLNVFEALDNHQKEFNNEYMEEDFRNITTFQRKISGRSENLHTGGTGLTKLIKSLEDKSETFRCYMISGKRCINFYKHLLEYDANGWIGFNEENNYLSNIPESDVATECFINMPGTAYNFNFVMKGEKIDAN